VQVGGELFTRQMTMGVDHVKSQIPNPKSQTPTMGVLGCLGFGFWDLEFGI
jgi:hypothetical protein